MRFGVFGAGSIGCYLGGRLIAAGHDVVLCGRLGGEVNAHGLTLTDYAGARVVLAPGQVRYGDDVQILADCDVVFLTVKGPATAAAAAALAEVVKPTAVVVSFQNGVTNADRLRAALPGRPVLAGMVPFNVVHNGNGHFHNGTSGPLELERGGRAAELRQALQEAGFAVVLHEDLRAVQWSKLLINLNNAVNALAGVPLREQLADRGYRLIMADVVREGLACLRAAGLKPVRLGRLVPSLAPAVLALPDWLFFRVAAAMVKVDPRARSSMWEDLDRRRATEVELLNGEIVRLGAKHGVAAPINRRLCALVHAAERARHGSPQLSAPALRAALSDNAPNEETPVTETAAPQNPFITPSPWNLVAAGYADSIAGHLAKYSADALRLAAVQPGEAVVDVAAGPGTLTRQAARITRVHALDFSAQMLAQLRERATPSELANIVTTEGDGQALPYASASFDVAFSMFGLFMFPDRVKGFAELARVLRPGGRAVVASWQSQDNIAAFALFYKGLAELAPELKTPRQGPLPLSDPDEFRREMAAAGLEVELHAVTHALQAPSPEALWTIFEQSHVGLAFLAESLGAERYERLHRALRQRFIDGLGAGPQQVEMPAWLALGRKPLG